MNSRPLTKKNNMEKINNSGTTMEKCCYVRVNRNSVNFDLEVLLFLFILTYKQMLIFLLNK